MSIELIYAPTSKLCIRKKVPYVEGMSITDVIRESAIELEYPEVSHYAVGIFSTIESRLTQVKPGDRVEIYPPLMIDPKEKRRQRVRS